MNENKKNSKNIVLTGMPGVGKTSVGKYLSRIRKDKVLIDTDKEIEKNTGLKIVDIFAKKGEMYFRDLEENEVKKLSNEVNLIITTGGGTILRETNINNLKKNGVIFYLKADIAVLLNRMEFDKSRPLLNDVSKEEKLQSLLASRQQLYEKADFVIDTNNKSVKKIAEEILKLYEQ